MTEINSKKLKKKKKERKQKSISLPALAVVVAKASYMRVTVPFWFYCKLIWSNAEKYPDKLEKLFTVQNIANLQGIGFTLDFGFKIRRDLTKLAPF